MNWDALGATGEVIGATAVVISLLYLGLQIRGQTRQARFAAAHDISLGYREAMDHFASTQISQIYIKGLSSIDDLEDFELFQLLLGAQKMLRVWEEAFYLNKDGQLHGEYWAGIDRQIRSYMGVPSFKHTWETRAEFYGEEFREMVEQSQPVEYRIRSRE
jgi:hypothetical protein